MESNIYDLMLIAVPIDSPLQNEMYDLLVKEKPLAVGTQIDLEDATEKELEKLMTTIMKKGWEHYGLETK